MVYKIKRNGVWLGYMLHIYISVYEFERIILPEYSLWCMLFWLILVCLLFCLDSSKKPIKYEYSNAGEIILLTTGDNGSDVKDLIHV